MSTIQINEWNFEVTRVTARKCAKFGDPFTGTGQITFANGEPHIESLIVDNGIDKTDIETLVKYLSSKGYNYYISSKIENGKRKLIKTFINKVR